LDVVGDIMQKGLGSTFPAAVLLIQQEGEIIFQRAYGWIDPEGKHWPISGDTVFDLASLTKLFTATAFMTLVGSGKIGLETPVSRVVPEFGGIYPILPGIDPHTRAVLPPIPEFEGRMVDAELVTFRHLLTHTSGLAAWDDFCRDVEGDDVPMPHLVPQTVRRRRLDAVLSNPRFVYPPGKQFLYSDLGFILLGEAIERLSEMPLPDYLERAVFRPLGIQVLFNPLAHNIPRASIAPTEFCVWRGRRIWGEVHDENAACLGGVAGHAGLFATARDVATFGQSFLDKDSPILRSELVEEMIRQQVHWQNVRRGLGWQLTGADGVPVGKSWSSKGFGHTGFTGTSLWIDPDRALSVVLLTNRVYYGRDGDAIARFRIQLHEAVASIADNYSENGQ
jgi:CubicO group peptidase (beta-lactamase class C family)